MHVWYVIKRVRTAYYAVLGLITSIEILGFAGDFRVRLMLYIFHARHITRLGKRLIQIFEGLFSEGQCDLLLGCAISASYDLLLGKNAIFRLSVSFANSPRKEQKCAQISNEV